MSEERRETMQAECVGPFHGNTMNAWVIRLMHSYSSMNFKRIQELGIHPGQLPVLGVLSKMEGISQREIADVLHVKPPTVTVTIQRLEKSGLVCKKPDEKDQRISRIYLTDSGKNLKEEIRHLTDEDERILTEGFSEEEQELMKKMIERMVNNMRRGQL